MLTADSPLVAGVQAPAAARTEAVRVVRPFFIGETRHDREEVLSLDWRLVQELVTAQKAVRVEESEAAPAPPARPVEPVKPAASEAPAAVAALLPDAERSPEQEGKE